MKKIIYLILITVSIFSAKSQSLAPIYNMGGLGTIDSCGGNFYDNGGALLNYTNLRFDTVTFCPGVAGQQVRLMFDSLFNLENNWDFLYIYDGSNTNAPLLGAFTGTTSPGTVTANNILGCLTVVFLSDSTGNSMGWHAKDTCVVTPPPAAHNDSCSKAIGFCTPTLAYSASFTTLPATPNVFSSTSYGCLFTSPNPTFFTIKTDSTGSLTYTLEGWDNGTPRDVDFLVWGPFMNPNTICSSYNLNNVIACSYSGSNIETVTFNTVAGAYYLILVTNFSNQPSNITLTQSPASTAHPSCAVSCNILYINTSLSACDTATNTFTLSGTVITKNKPQTGSCIVSTQCGSNGMVADTIPLPFASDTIPYSIRHVPATGTNCVISASFTSNSLCSSSLTYLSSLPCECKTKISTDSVVCSGSFIKLKTTAIVGGTYSWVGPNGWIGAGQYPSVYNVPIASTGNYIVTATNGSCVAKDTFFVKVISAFDPNAHALKDTICKYGSTSIVSTPTPASLGPFTYLWSPSNQVVNLNDSITPVFPGVTTDYHVLVKSAAGCVVLDTVRVAVVGVGPKVNILADKNNVCLGDTIQLTSYAGTVINGLTPGGLAAACQNSTVFLSDTINPPLTTSGSTVTPFRGYYHDGRVQYLYTAAEMQARGMQAGTITGIAFFIPPTGKASTQPYTDLTVKMMATSLTQLPATFIPNIPNVMQPTSTTTNTGFNPLQFTDPYDWDGFSNLLIEVNFDNTSYTGYDQVYYYSGGTNCTLYDQADFSHGPLLSTPNQSNLKPVIRFDMCLPPTSNFTYSWTPTTGLSCSNCLNPSVVLNNNQTYTLHVADGNCSGDKLINLNVNPDVIISAGADKVSCGDSVLLIVNPVNPVIPVCVPDYTVTSIAPAPVSPTGSTTTVSWAIGDGDSGSSGTINLPFTFTQYCNTFTNLKVSSNGYIVLGTTSPSSYATPFAPLPDATVPENMIALCWADLDVSSFGTGNIDYFTKGTAPNRIFVVRWNNAGFWFTNDVVNGQIELYETSNLVKIITMNQNSTSNFNTYTQGMQNSTGTVANTVPGRNNTLWTSTTPTAWQFTPMVSGSSPVSYSWSPANLCAQPTNDSTKVKPAGSQDFIALVTFSNGCKSRDTVNVRKDSLAYTVNVNPTTICPGDTVQITFTSATANQIHWTPINTIVGADTNSFTPKVSVLNTSPITFTASTPSGCTVTNSITVNTQSAASVKLSQALDSICPGDSAKVFTKNQYSNYAWYSLEPSRTLLSGNSDTLVPAASNMYQVKVKSGICYYYSDTFTLRNYTPQTVTASKSDSICLGSSIPIAGTAGLSNYVWNPGNQNTPIISVNATGNYFYKAKDMHGCNVHSDTAIILVRDTPIIHFPTLSNPYCDGKSVVIDAGSQPSVSYTWNPGGVSNSVTATGSTTYTVTASNINQLACAKTGTIQVSFVPNPVVALPTLPAVCSCDTHLVIKPTTTSIIPAGSTYVWSGGTAAGDSVKVTTAGTYSLSITDPNGCTANGSSTVAINCFSIHAKASDTTVNLGSTTDLSVDSFKMNSLQLPNNSYSYIWTPNGTLSATTTQTTTATPDSSQTYTVLVTDNTTGCAAKFPIHITVIPPGAFTMPNAFTPNGDAKNARFLPVIPTGSSAKIVDFKIYNQWGEMVFDQTKSTDTGWDGNYKDAIQPVGVYTYYIYLDVPNKVNPSLTDRKVETGSLTLIR